MHFASCYAPASIPPVCASVWQTMLRRQSLVLLKAVEQLCCFHRGCEGLFSMPLAAGAAPAAVPGDEDLPHCILLVLSLLLFPSSGGTPPQTPTDRSP